MSRCANNVKIKWFKNFDFSLRYFTYCQFFLFKFFAELTFDIFIFFSCLKNQNFDISTDYCYLLRKFSAKLVREYSPKSYKVKSKGQMLDEWYIQI
jgi:hypothetical protein